MVDSALPFQRDAFTNHVVSLGTAAWWHVISNGWLIADNEGKANAAGWRDLAMQFMPGATVFVQEIGGPGEWAVVSPVYAHKWLHDFWE